MALPAIMRRLFAGGGYGPLLKDDIVSKYISIQDWSSSFDYQPATAVRGSDGKPYWSVAASGPNSGGAANPVGDGGAHWVSLPSMADIAAMNYATQSWVGSQNYATQSWVGSQGFATQSWVGSQNYATQSWVKGRSSAAVYVNPNGSDSNDGLTQSTPVATFAKAVEICNALPEDKHYIWVAAGAYSGKVVLESLTFVLLLEGNVTLNDGLEISTGANVCITSASSSISPLLTIYNGQSQSCINVSTFAQLYTFVGFSLIGNSNASHLISIYNYSSVIFYGNSIGNMCSMTPNGISGNCISVFHCSNFTSNIFLEATGNSLSADGYVAVGEASTAEFTDGFAFASLECSTPIYASDSSYIHFSCLSRNKGITFTCNSNDGTGCLAQKNSHILFDNFWFVTANVKSSGSAFVANSGSMILIDTPASCNVYVESTSGATCRNAFHSYLASVIFLTGPGDIRLNGAYTHIFDVDGGNSTIHIDPSVTFTNWASGKKVYAYNGAQIDTGGRAIDSLPGTAGDYTVDAASFAHYA